MAEDEGNEKHEMASDRKEKTEYGHYRWQDPSLQTFVKSGRVQLLTTDSEGAARHHFPVCVFHRVVALVCLRHSLGHPDLPLSQQPPPPSTAGVGVRPVPQYYWHGLGGRPPGVKLQYVGFFRDGVLKVLPVISLVGLDALCRAE